MPYGSFIVIACSPAALPRAAPLTVEELKLIVPKLARGRMPLL
jgi:hypothetical protein